MPKVVATPTGQAVVLTEVEFDYFVASQQQTEAVRDPQGRLFCSKCNLELLEIEIVHPVFKDSKNDLLVFDDAEDYAAYPVAFCPKCEGRPQTPNIPIVMTGSYYNLPH